MSRKYDRLIIDVVNVCHKTFQKNNTTLTVGSKVVYKESICNFIRSVESLVKDYLYDDGEVYFLFDNYFSRADLKTSFMFADRKDLDESYKQTRKKENREFYNSVNFLKYYYLTDKPMFRTVQIQGLEADDLVKPLLQSDHCKDKTCLLVSSDLDWVRYLSDEPEVDWLPSFKEEVKTLGDVSAELGFKVTEDSIILYKAIFGDVSDNIEGMITLNDKNKEKFIEVIKDYPTTISFTTRSRTNQDCEMFKKINEDERKFFINIQLVSSIPCDPSHIDVNLSIGDDNKAMHKVVREAMGLDESKKGFVFGNVKRPRCS